MNNTNTTFYDQSKKRKFGEFRPITIPNDTAIAISDLNQQDPIFKLLQAQKNIAKKLKKKTESEEGTKGPRLGAAWPRRGRRHRRRRRRRPRPLRRQGGGGSAGLPLAKLNLDRPVLFYLIFTFGRPDQCFILYWVGSFRLKP